MRIMNWNTLVLKLPIGVLYQCVPLQCHTRIFTDESKIGEAVVSEAILLSCVTHVYQTTLQSYWQKLQEFYWAMIWYVSLQKKSCCFFLIVYEAFKIGILIHSDGDATHVNQNQLINRRYGLATAFSDRNVSEQMSLKVTTKGSKRWMVIGDVMW